MSTLEIVTGIIEKIVPYDIDVCGDSYFVEDFSFDSLDQIELIIHVENAFNVRLWNNEAEKINTVNELIRQIELRVNI